MIICVFWTGKKKKNQKSTKTWHSEQKSFLGTSVSHSAIIRTLQLTLSLTYP